MKTTEFRFRAKPKRETYEDPEDQQYYDYQWQEMIDWLPDGTYDGTYVYGWYVDGYIVGEIVEVNDEYINLEYWIPVIPETVCILIDEVET